MDKKDGHLYKTGAGVITKMEHNLPKVGQIINIYTINAHVNVLGYFHTPHHIHSAHYRAYMMDSQNLFTGQTFYVSFLYILCKPWAFPTQIVLDHKGDTTPDQV